MKLIIKALLSMYLCILISANRRNHGWLWKPYWSTWGAALWGEQNLITLHQVNNLLYNLIKLDLNNEYTSPRNKHSTLNMLESTLFRLLNERTGP